MATTATGFQLQGVTTVPGYYQDRNGTPRAIDLPVVNGLVYNPDPTWLLWVKFAVIIGSPCFVIYTNLPADMALWKVIVITAAGTTGIVVLKALRDLVYLGKSCCKGDGAQAKTEAKRFIRNIPLALLVPLGLLVGLFSPTRGRDYVYRSIQWANCHKNREERNRDKSGACYFPPCFQTCHDLNQQPAERLRNRIADRAANQPAVPLISHVREVMGYVDELALPGADNQAAIAAYVSQATYNRSDQQLHQGKLDFLASQRSVAPWICRSSRLA
jgi:hypothetical protein